MPLLPLASGSKLSEKMFSRIERYSNIVAAVLNPYKDEPTFGGKVFAEKFSSSSSGGGGLTRRDRFSKGNSSKRSEVDEG